MTTLGRLETVPALEGVGLLADPVSASLRDRGLEAWVAPIDPSLADTASFCDAYDVAAVDSANCVILAGRRGDTERIAACVVLATTRADVNGAIRRHLDVKKLSFAPMDSAVGWTGMEYGGITPIGLPAQWPILIDRRVTERPLVVVGSGVRHSKIVVRGADLAALPGAQVLDLVTEVAP